MVRSIDQRHVDVGAPQALSGGRPPKPPPTMTTRRRRLPLVSVGTDGPRGRGLGIRWHPQGRFGSSWSGKPSHLLDPRDLTSESDDPRGFGHPPDRTICSRTEGSQPPSGRARGDHPVWAMCHRGRHWKIPARPIADPERKAVMSTAKAMSPTKPTRKEQTNASRRARLRHRAPLRRRRFRRSRAMRSCPTATPARWSHPTARSIGSACLASTRPACSETCSIARRALSGWRRSGSTSRARGSMSRVPTPSSRRGTRRPGGWWCATR